MRTKALLLTAALTGAGVMASMAVTSQNVVGYINVSVPPGFSLIANQLVNNAEIQALIPAPPSQTTVYTLVGGSFVANSFDLLGDSTWLEPTTKLSLGSGALIFNPEATAFTVTFVGEVEQGTHTTAIDPGFSIVSSRVPQEGGITTVLGFAPDSGDAAYQLVGGSFAGNQFDLLGDSTWAPAEPTLKVGEAVLVASTAGKDWTRTFNIP